MFGFQISEKQPLRCDECNRFISYDDLESGVACHELVTLETPFTAEEYLTLCCDHYEKKL